MGSLSETPLLAKSAESGAPSLRSGVGMTKDGLAVRNSTSGEVGREWSTLASLGRRNDKDGLAVRNSTSGEVGREWSTLASLVGVFKNLFNAEDTEDAEKLILRGTTCMMERRGQLGWLRFFRISFS